MGPCHKSVIVVAYPYPCRETLALANIKVLGTLPPQDLPLGS
ncbi:hypothetical protein PS874_04484 [Pseudomonas fluorescens]|nr:hypothetical protein PS874_04484 [Pseudomonas fluorescens]